MAKHKDFTVATDVQSTSAIRKVLGSAARTKTRTGYYDNTSREELTCLATLKRTRPGRVALESTSKKDPGISDPASKLQASVASTIELRRNRPCGFQVSGNACGFRGSAQHLRAVYSLESESPKFFAGVDLDAARSCPVELACSRKGRFSLAGIVAASGWCFRLFLVARGCADHRNRLSHSWRP